MDLRKSICNQTDFSLRIAKHILLKPSNGGQNIVFSPSSIHVVLSLIAAGSKEKTLEQLLSFLRSESNEELNTLSSQLIELILTDASQSGGPKLSFINGVWVEKSLPLKRSFQEITNKLYKVTPKQVDFQTQYTQVANEVNTWAEKETSGLIKELLSPASVDSSTRLISGNALYFKGAWKEKFDGTKTTNSDFHLLDGSSVQVPFMTSNKKQLLSSFAGFQVLTLPYQQGADKRQFSMYFFLPHERDGLPNLVEKMGSDSGFIDRHLPIEKVEVGEFRIPKFKFSFGLEASADLKELGLSLPFSDAGDLTEMVDSPVSKNLYVSSISHKAVIEVNEEGTEAAAATAAVFSLRSLPTRMDFVADHPFVFLIREDMTGVILFIGHVLNPLFSN